MAAATCTKLSQIAARGCIVLRYSPGVLQYNASSKSTFSTSSAQEAEKKYKLLIVGGGTGGTAIANKFSNRLGQGQVAVIEPSERHYNQALFTLVGGGLRQFNETYKPTASCLPTACDWIKQRVTGFDPDNNTVTIDNGDKLSYDFLLVTLGVELDYKKVKGSLDALEKDPRVCSNYHPTYVQKTIVAARNFKGGQAVFTLPDGPLKCAGAPQKIAYLLEEQFNKNGIRGKTDMVYNTALPVMFAVPRYAAELTKVADKKNIEVNFRHNLIEVRKDTSEAVFELLDDPGKTTTFKYDLLHISPPCSPPPVLKRSPLADASGFLAVDAGSMQHVTYPNVFGVGDCTNVPTSKTAAAVSGQVAVASRNLKRLLDGNNEALEKTYDGYTSCPLVVSSKECILAEFGYNQKILETMPMDQSKPSKLAFFVKSRVLPPLYWGGLVRGMWHGPSTIRKILHLGMERTT